MWSPLIIAILEFVAPFVQDWLKDCGKERAEEAAAELPPVESFASEHVARVALLDKMLDNLPRLAFVRRGTLRFVKRVTAECGVTSTGAARPMSEDEAAVLKDLAAAAARE